MAANDHSEIIAISVVIPVRNEEAMLPECLSRLANVAEVIVVDSSSTDNTQQIAEDFGAKYVNFHWNGRFPKKRNWVLFSELVKQDWVLFLDADEFVDDGFWVEVASAIKSGDKVGYWLTYDIFFLGQRLRYGIPQRKLALFKVGSGYYERIDEDHWSSLDMEVHEHPLLDGPVGWIKTRIDHRDDRGLVAFIRKHCDYAQWEAARYAKLRSDEPAWSKLQLRQRFKYRCIDSWWFSSLYFILTFFARFGFLDGSIGFQYAFYKAWYFNTIRLLIKQSLRS